MIDQYTSIIQNTKLIVPISPIMNTIVYRLILIAAWEAQEVEKSEQAGGDEAR